MSSQRRIDSSRANGTLKNQKFHYEPSSAKTPPSDEDRPAREASPIPSAIDQRPSTRNRLEPRLSAELRRTLKLPDAYLKNQEFHYEPSSAKTPPSDEDRPASEAPRIPSANGHRPSTTLDGHFKNQKISP